MYLFDLNHTSPGAIGSLHEIPDIESTFDVRRQETVRCASCFEETGHSRQSSAAPGMGSVDDTMSHVDMAPFSDTSTGNRNAARPTGLTQVISRPVSHTESSTSSIPRTILPSHKGLRRLACAVNCLG